MSDLLIPTEYKVGPFTARFPAKNAPAITHLEDDPDANARVLGQLQPYLSEFQLLGDRVLVAIYQRPEMTAGGIIRPDENLEEDKHQGKVGLVVAMGPRAFQDEPENGVYWHGQGIDIGQWVVFRIQDAVPVTIGGVFCRYVRDRTIFGVTNRPDLFW